MDHLGIFTDTSLVIIGNLSEPQSQSALSCVEDKALNEERATGAGYCSHFLPCQLCKLRMMFLFVLHFICCKVLDLAQNDTRCTAPPIKAVSAVVRAGFEGEKREVVGQK